MRLELVPVPVADVDQANAFYEDQVGFVVDHDVRPADGVRVVQLTPPGSACSILLSAGLPGVEMESGTLRGLHLVVDDMGATRTDLVGRGVEVSEVQDVGGMLYAYFSDLDENTWALQQMPVVG